MISVEIEMSKKMEWMVKSLMVFSTGLVALGMWKLGEIVLQVIK